ncbi:ChaB protein [Micromonospora nigra]|uniref:ChaB protein n=1 Tax=Micromonospora nigra TaxID=145857 RepID=A0A1C6S7X7_9ACTN|nr:ChaB protein [Micromonospora nigra]
MPARKDMPSTLKRSPKKAQDTYAEAHDSAVDSYGEGKRAHRTAFAAVKHSFEKADALGQRSGGVTWSTIRRVPLVEQLGKGTRV